MRIGDDLEHEVIAHSNISKFLKIPCINDWVEFEARDITWRASVYRCVRGSRRLWTVRRGHSLLGTDGAASPHRRAERKRLARSSGHRYLCGWRAGFALQRSFLPPRQRTAGTKSNHARRFRTPSLDDLYMGALDPRAPYGPRNPPPPPSAPPPSAPPPHAPHRPNTDAPCRHLHRGHPGSRPSESSYDAEHRGRPPSPLPDYHGVSPDSRSYRERSSQRNRSLTAPRESYRSPSARFSHRSPSFRPAVEGRYSRRPLSSPRRRSRSPRRHSRQEHEGYEYMHRRRQRSLTPVAVRERRISSSDVPETAYPLRTYTNYIAENHAANRRNTLQNLHMPVFRNGDGKVNPSAYGSVLQYDFGLCYCTFRTVHLCEMETKCPWRHHPLSAREKRWIEEIAFDKGTHFIQEAEKCWAYPDVPVPGHNMIEVMQKERDDRRRR